MPADFNTLVKFFKIPSKLGFTMVFCLLVALFGFLSGEKIVGLIGLFLFLGILSRQPAVYSDAIKECEVVSTLGMILAIGLGSWLAFLFVFGSLWISNLVSPWGKGEDMMYLVMDSVNMGVLMFAVPWLFAYCGFQIITMMFWFYVLRAILYIVEVPFIKMATWPTSTFLTIVGIFIAITQAYIVLHVLAGFSFGVLGVSGWSFGALPLFNPIS